MPSRQPPEPQPVDAHSAEHIYILRRLNGKDPLLRVQSPLILDIVGGQYVLKLSNVPQATPVGFMGEYDPTQSYPAMSTFLVSTATTIAGIAVIAGFYGVPPAGTDVNGLPWAGVVPANPTGNAVPQSPLPSLGAAPNDKFYAKLIMPSC